MKRRAPNAGQSRRRTAPKHDEPHQTTESEECCVCYNELDSNSVGRYTWTCGHRVCSTCDGRLRQESYECPMCRAERRDGSVRPLRTVSDGAYIRNLFAAINTDGAVADLASTLLVFPQHMIAQARGENVVGAHESSNRIMPQAIRTNAVSEAPSRHGMREALAVGINDYLRVIGAEVQELAVRNSETGNGQPNRITIAVRQSSESNENPVDYINRLLSSGVLGQALDTIVANTQNTERPSGANNRQRARRRVNRYNS